MVYCQLPCWGSSLNRRQSWRLPGAAVVAADSSILLFNCRHGSRRLLHESLTSQSREGRANSRLGPISILVRDSARDCHWHDYRRTLRLNSLMSGIHRSAKEKASQAGRGSCENNAGVFVHVFSSSFRIVSKFSTFLTVFLRGDSFRFNPVQKRGSQLSLRTPSLS